MENDITVEINLGAVRSRGSTLSFSLKVKHTGTGFLQVYAGDSDGRKSGTVLFLNETEYGDLKTIINKAEKAIQDLRRSGRLQETKFVR